jgi:hypothetical protein
MIKNDDALSLYVARAVALMLARFAALAGIGWLVHTLMVAQ